MPPVRNTRSRPDAPAHARRSIGAPERPLDSRILAGVIVYFVLLAAGALLAPSWSWGFDFLRYTSSVVDLLIVVPLAALVIIAPARRFLGRVLETPRLHGIRPGIWWAAALFVSIAAAYAAAQWPVPSALLGDGAYYAGEMYRGLQDPAYQPAFLKWTSWLSGETLLWVGRMLEPDNTRLPFTITGAACLASSIFALFLFLRREKGPFAIALSTAVLGGAGSLLFFSYVELYTFAFLFAGLYLLSSWSALRTGTPVWIPGLMLAVGIAFALPLVFFAPSYLLLLHWKIRGEGGAFPLRRAAFVLVAITVAAFPGVYALQAAGTVHGLLMPFTAAGETSYSLVSFQHLRDVLNVTLLNAGVFAVVLIVAGFAGRRRGILSSPLVLVFATAAAGGMLFVLCGDTVLGLARDWDVMAAPLLALPFLAVALLHGLQERGDLSLASFSFPVPAAGVVLLFLWLRVNIGFSETHRADIARFENIVRMYDGVVLPVHSYTGFENLRQVYHNAGEEAKEFEMLHGMLGTRHLPVETIDRFTNSASNSRNAALRIAAYEGIVSAIDAALDDADLRDRIGGTRIRELATRVLLYAAVTGEKEFAAALLTKLRERITPWPEAGIVDAFLVPSLPVPEQAKRARAAIDSSCSDAALLFAAARLQGMAGEYQSAASLFKRGLALEPAQYPSAYLELAKILFENLGDTAGAVATLQTCIRESKHTREAEEARTVLARMQAAGIPTAQE